MYRLVIFPVTLSDAAKFHYPS